jgi:phage terminase large subunit GpA-like protein
MLADAFSTFWGGWCEGLEPPPRLSVTEWADTYRRLPSRGAAEPGQWRTSRTPYLKEIMGELGDTHPARKVVFVKSAQVGGSETGLNWLGWAIATQKAPVLVVLPTIQLADRYSRQRLDAMVAECPSLAAQLPSVTAREGGNSVSLKQWPGGVLFLTGANSAASLRSMPVRYLLLEEVDAYPLTLDEEGDPVALAEARTATFARAKVFMLSTPTLESSSRIWREWLASDRRRYHVPCPECGHRQPLEFENLKWPEGEPDKAMMHCTECGTGIEHTAKADLLEAGEWVAEVPEAAVAGFHISAIYCPPGLGPSWADIAAQWELVKGDAQREATFRNLVLGLPAADKLEAVDALALASRAGGYQVGEVPQGCLVLTAGVDVQKNRLAVVVLGHGEGGRMFVVDHAELHGDPLEPQVWQLLQKMLEQAYSNGWGRSLYVRQVAVDSGFLPETVHAFVRPRVRNGYFAVKGHSTPGKPIITKASQVEFNGSGRKMAGGAQVWMVGSDTAKLHIHQLLAGDARRDEPLVRFPHGLSSDFYSQLTAETYNPVTRRWVKNGRNESLDCMAYALAASRHPNLRLHALPAAWWASLRQQLEGGEPSLEQSQPVAQTAPAVRGRRRIVSNYLTRSY